MSGGTTSLMLIQVSWVVGWICLLLAIRFVGYANTLFWMVKEHCISIGQTNTNILNVIGISVCDPTRMWAEAHPIRRTPQNNKERKKAVVRKIKESMPCADCNNYYPYYVMQFDHYDGDKTGNISDLIHNHSIEQALEEIAKCVLVCANCHAHRTWLRLVNSMV
jgi:hypothetical protein